MTEAAKRYLELLNEMEWHRATESGLTQPQEARLAGQLDAMWNKLSESEQSQIEDELRSIDEADRQDFLCDDADDSLLGEGPRRAA